MGIMKKIQLMRENEQYIPVAFRRFAGIEKPKKKKFTEEELRDWRRQFTNGLPDRANILLSKT